MSIDYFIGLGVGVLIGTFFGLWFLASRYSYFTNWERPTVEFFIDHVVAIFLAED